MAMVAAACADACEAGLAASRFAVTDLDGPRPGGLPNYTVDTLTALRALYPGDTLFNLAKRRLLPRPPLAARAPAAARTYRLDRRLRAPATPVAEERLSAISPPNSEPASTSSPALHEDVSPRPA